MLLIHITVYGLQSFIYFNEMFEVAQKAFLLDIHHTLPMPKAQ